LYIVKSYTASTARKNIAEVLDLAAGGEAVIINRRGVRFVLRMLPKSSPTKKHASRIEIVDPAVESGTWSWQWSPDGLASVAPPGRSASSEALRSDGSIT
jgi:antitoxin (DNA-binding transcriptional repressor) of toxin-antitoxin stability system